MGHSNGGLIGAWFGTKYNKIKRLLLVNAPLMYNYHKTKDALVNFNKEKITLIYGSLDQSFPYVGLLDRIHNEKVKYYIIDGQDHYSSNNCYDF